MGLYLRRKRSKPYGTGRKAVVAGLIALAFIYLSLSFLLGDKGLLRYLELRKERVALNAEIAALKDENAAIKGKVGSLRTDPDAIESLAREQGLVKHGEIIYQYEEK